MIWQLLSISCMGIWMGWIWQKESKRKMNNGSVFWPKAKKDMSSWEEEMKADFKASVQAALKNQYESEVSIQVKEQLMRKINELKG